MALRPICEPVELPLGASVLAERVAIAADAGEIGRFMHFHDVAELVLFRRVSGEFIAGGHRHALAAGAIIFVPSMRHHDFALGRGPMEWVLVQLDPYLVESLATRPALARLTRPFCAVPDKVAQARMESLADWLVEAARDPGDPAIERIVELLLLTAADTPEAHPFLQDERNAHFECVLPVLEQLRSAPAQQITLESAAGLCSLSPAYFSRRFKQATGMNFTEYARVYRIHLAARRLATTRTPISEIAYGVGFSSPAHFSARFRERFGMTPRAYRASARERSSGAGRGSRR
jgi:AraC-like DNA-binding protein